jgi:DNA helicase IV
MRDIVATVQPEQDLLVRAPLEQTVCVQGAPGTGKTAVGLHRAAYLLYAHRARLAATGCWSSGRTARSCPTSRRSCRRSARCR